MARLIDADALMDAFRRVIAERHDRERCVSEENCNTCERECLWRRVVKKAPTIDAVPVVRCKDCKHYKSTLFCNFHKHRIEEIGTCTRYSFGWGPSMAKPGGFCSYGERRSDV